jgi:hypothetical protein
MRIPGIVGIQASNHNPILLSGNVPKKALTVVDVAHTPLLFSQWVIFFPLGPMEG